MKYRILTNGIDMKVQYGAWYSPWLTVKCSTGPWHEGIQARPQDRMFLTFNQAMEFIEEQKAMARNRKDQLWGWFGKQPWHEMYRD